MNSNYSNTNYRVLTFNVDGGCYLKPRTHGIEVMEQMKRLPGGRSPPPAPLSRNIVTLTTQYHCGS